MIRDVFVSGVSRQTAFVTMGRVGRHFLRIIFGLHRRENLAFTNEGSCGIRAAEAVSLLMGLY